MFDDVELFDRGVRIDLSNEHNSCACRKSASRVGKGMVLTFI